MSEAGLFFYGITAFIVSIFSAMGGGGGGFILTPLAIFLGLSPAQAVATGKFGGFAAAAGTLTGMRGHKVEDKSLLKPLLLVAAAVGIGAPLLIQSIDASIYKKAIGVVLIVMALFMMKTNLGAKTIKVTQRRKTTGLAVVVLGYLLVAVFSSGLGLVINIAMMGMLGMNATDTIVIKRSITLVMNLFLMFGVIYAGLVVWQVVAVGLTGGIGGSFIGGELALKMGSKFISRVMAVLAFVSGAGLLLV